MLNILTIQKPCLT